MWFPCTPPLRRWFVGLLLVLPGSGWSRHAADEVIVRFKTGIHEDEAQAIIRGMGGHQRDVLEQFRTRLVKLPPGLSVDAAIARWRHDPRVEWVEPNVQFFPKALPNDPLLAYQWGLERIGAKLAWGMTVAGAQGSDDVVIGYIDDGIDSTHPDLAGKVLPGWDIVQGIPNAEPDSPDGYSHGTFGASIAAAETGGGIGMAGVAWKARLLPVKFPSIGGASAGEFLIAKSVTWAVDHGAKVINMSLGTCNYDPFSGLVVCEDGGTLGAEAMEDAYRRGAVIVAAAGNESTTMSSYPAAWPFVLGVAATGATDWAASYSNLGPQIDVAAPGGDGALVPCDTPYDVVGATTDTTSTCAALGFSPNLHETGEGTSFACPHVSGLAAVLFGQDPARTNDQVAGLIRSTADQPLAATGWNDTFGYGRINMYTALTGPFPTPAAALTVAMTPGPANVVVGQTWTLVQSVRNTGTGDANDLAPTVRFSGGGGLLTPLSTPPYVGALVLAPGASQSFTWTWSATGAGPVTFSARVSAADVRTGASVGETRTGTIAVGAVRQPEAALPMAYPNPLSGDVLKISVPLPAGSSQVTVRVFNAATMQLAYEGTWQNVAQAEAGVVVHGAAAWAPGMYLVRVTAAPAGGAEKVFAPVKVLVRR